MPCYDYTTHIRNFSWSWITCTQKVLAFRHFQDVFKAKICRIPSSLNSPWPLTILHFKWAKKTTTFPSHQTNLTFPYNIRHPDVFFKFLLPGCMDIRSRRHPATQAPRYRWGRRRNAVDGPNRCGPTSGVLLVECSGCPSGKTVCVLCVWVC